MAKRSLHEQQNSMGLYLRDPEHCAPPAEMDPARAQVYRDLVFANLSSLISGTFPVLVKILGDERGVRWCGFFCATTAPTRRNSARSPRSLSSFWRLSRRRWPRAPGRRSWSSWRITNGSKWRCNNPRPSLCRPAMARVAGSSVAGFAIGLAVGLCLAGAAGRAGLSARCCTGSADLVAGASG